MCISQNTFIVLVGRGKCKFNLLKTVSMVIGYEYGKELYMSSFRYLIVRAKSVRFAQNIIANTLKENC